MKPEIIVCMDCSEVYPLSFMVTTSTWHEAGFVTPFDGIICLPCFETRLSRELKITDFVPSAFVNNTIIFGFNMGKRCLK